jgi:hypothetical protein
VDSAESVKEIGALTIGDHGPLKPTTNFVFDPTEALNTHGLSRL